MISQSEAYLLLTILKWGTPKFWFYLILDEQEWTQTKYGHQN